MNVRFLITQMIEVIHPAVRSATRYLAAFAALALICATGLAQSAERAGGGGGSNTGGGTIYYLGPQDGATQGGISSMRAMNSDGTNNRQLLDLLGNPSLALHGGHRFFLTLQTPGVSNPDGELFALRDDYDPILNNNSTTRVQLTYDVDLQIRFWTPNWVLGDQKISFVARRFSGGVVTEGGIYTASLLFDVADNIIGLAAQPTAPAISFPLAEVAPGDLWPDLTHYSWASTGDRVVCTRVGNSGLWVADLLGGAHQRIFTGSAAKPQWAPDGTKIAFSYGSSIATIKPNGSQLRVVAAAFQNWTFFFPYWSPASTHLAFTGQRQEGSQFNMDVMRATATGGSRTDLTNQPYPFNETIDTFGGGGWR